MSENPTLEVVIDDKTYQPGDVIVRESEGKTATIIEVARNKKKVDGIHAFMGYYANITTKSADGEKVALHQLIHAAHLKQWTRKADGTQDAAPAMTEDDYDAQMVKLEQNLAAADALLKTLQAERLQIIHAVNGFVTDPNVELPTRVAMLREAVRNDQIKYDSLNEKYLARCDEVNRLQDEKDALADSRDSAVELADAANERATAATFGKHQPEVEVDIVRDLTVSTLQKSLNAGWGILHIQFEADSLNAVFQREKQADPAPVQPTKAETEAAAAAMLITDSAGMPVSARRAERVPFNAEHYLKNVLQDAVNEANVVTAQRLAELTPRLSPPTHLGKSPFRRVYP